MANVGDRRPHVALLYVLGGSLAVAMLLFQAALQAGPGIRWGASCSVYFIIAGTWLFHEHLPASPGLRQLACAWPDDGWPC